MENLPNTTPDASGVAEIIRLHDEITFAAKTTLDKAIRVGELLTTARAESKHGHWLPWCKTNLPFTDRTARNYIRLFENRERLKLETVSDLTAAYALLAPPEPPIADRVKVDASPTKWEPTAGALTSGSIPPRHGMCRRIWIYPSVHAGYFFVNFWDDDGHETTGTHIVGTVKALRSDRIGRLIQSQTGSDPAAVCWQSSFGLEPWLFNEELFHNHQDYINRHILGKGGLGILGEGGFR